MHLEQDEQIIRIIRKHPFFMILETIGIVILAFVPNIIIAIWNWVFSYLPTDWLGNLEITNILPVNLQAFLYLLWLLFLWILFFTRFTDYYLDKWVLTNKRVIDVEQRGFFAREVSSVKYSKIQDATVEVSGLIATLLNFGTITIQSAGAVQEFMLPLAPNPLINKELIMELKEKYSSHTH